MRRPWWSRPDLLAVAALLAAGLGAWQATRMADWLGFGPERPAERARRSGRPGAQRPESAVELAARSGDGPRAAGWPDGPSAGPLGGVEAGVSGAQEPSGQPWDDQGWAPTEEETEGWTSTDWERYMRADAARKHAQAPAMRMKGFLEGLQYSPGLREPIQTAAIVRDDTWVEPVGAAQGASPEVDQVAPASAGAAGGGQVVLRGRHLRVSQVMFGAAAARITRATADSVTVEVPPSRPGPVVIAVTNADGTFVIVRQPFTYLD